MKKIFLTIFSLPEKVIFCFHPPGKFPGTQCLLFSSQIYHWEISQACILILELFEATLMNNKTNKKVYWHRKQNINLRKNLTCPRENYWSSHPLSSYFSSDTPFLQPTANLPYIIFWIYKESRFKLYKYHCLKSFWVCRTFALFISYFCCQESCLHVTILLCLHILTGKLLNKNMLFKWT